MAEVELILRRFSDLKAMRQPWEPLWQEITDYVLPRRSFWDLEAEQGKKPEVKVYDGSAISALQLLVDGLQGYLVSPKVRWFKLVMEDSRLMEQGGVADWLENAEDVLYAEFSRSNFYESINEFFMDAASIGTASMYVEDDIASKRVLFSARHMKECYIAEGRTGYVDTLYREFMLTNKQVLQTWPEGSLSPQRREDARQNPFGLARIIHACYPRTDRFWGKIDQYNKAWASVYIDKDHKTQIDEGGYDRFPYLVWRWRKNSDELYGRSPAADAIQDILRINQIAKTSLQAAQLAVEPPLNVPQAMKGQTRILPRGENYYTNPTEVVTPINLAQNYPVGQDQETSIKEQIRDIFRTKIFLLMEQLESGNYTATEIRERQGEKAAVLGAVIGRLNSECLTPLIERVYDICRRNMLLEPPPAVLAKGGRAKIEFEGPLAQAQKRYHETQGVVATLQFIAPILQMNPNAADNVDWDELMRIGMQAQGAPQKVIRERADVDKLRALRAQAAERQRREQQDQADKETLAANADKLNQQVQSGSMMEGALVAAAEQARRKTGRVER